MICDQALPPEAVKGIQLFNAGLFFEAHEALEIAWRAETHSNRNLYQGILQLGVGYYHLQRENSIGALHLFQKALKTLEILPAYCQSIEIDLIRKQIQEAICLVGQNRTMSFSNYPFPLNKIRIDGVFHE